MIPLLTSMSRFPKYSLANQMLIFAQRPAATCVMGYRAWNKAGYQVRKGENGIAIYAPMLFASKRDTAAESNSDAPARLGYRVAYVFDFAQMDAIAGTDAAAVAATPVDTGTHRHLEALKAFLVGHNVELEYRQLAPGLLGYTDGRRITFRLGQASHVEFATLAHEATDVLLPFDRNAEGYVAMHDDMNGDNDHRWITRLFQLVTAG